jgi:coenzyme F420-reducing hydrogenase beta subunit
MISISKKHECSGCKACYNICPKNCIDMIIDEEGFWYPKVNEDKCINCDLCEKVCPEINICSNKKSNKKSICLAAWNNDKNKRFDSSSGGIFTSIAEWILSNDGVIFGVGYDSVFNVIHKETHTIEGLKELRGSKYVQSDINDTYKITREYLKKYKKVLFVGTPCQIAGLYNFLGKDYDELYTCDLVCHGVPSPMVYKKYLDYLKYEYKTEVETISFRNKQHGWKNYSFFIRFTDGKFYSKLGKDNNYIIGFLRDYFLRPSCYSCKHKKTTRYGDITLADFWGVGGKYPELDDDKGTSLLLVNSEKGKIIIDSCKDSIFSQPCDLDYAIMNNPCIVKSGKKPKLRENFFEDFNNRDFKYVMKKYMNPPSWIKMKIITIKRILGFIKRTTIRLLK